MQRTERSHDYSVGSGGKINTHALMFMHHIDDTGSFAIWSMRRYISMDCDTPNVHAIRFLFT